MECDICGAVLATKYLLRVHFDKHKDLTCNVCGRKYTNSFTLRYHLQTHFDKSFFRICDICGKSVNYFRLKRHIERHDPQKSQITRKEGCYPCQYCGLIFTTTNNRWSHEKRLHVEKPNFGIDTNFKCDICLSTFLTKEEFKAHGFTHFTGKIHYCDFPECNKKFTKGKLLTIHKRCHFEPQFKCTYCGLVFVQYSGVSKHQRKSCPVLRSIERVFCEKTEEDEKTARIAKEQFIELNPKRNKVKKLELTSKKCKEQNLNKKLNQKARCIRKTVIKKLDKIPARKSSRIPANKAATTLEEKSVKIPNENLKKKSTKIHSPAISQDPTITDRSQLTEIVKEEWQYEFLDEATMEPMLIEDSQVFVEELTEKNLETQEVPLDIPKNEVIILMNEVQHDRKYQEETNSKNEVEIDNRNYEKLYKKFICGELNESGSHLINHMHAKHIPKKNKYFCDIGDCKAAFSLQKLFIDHKRGFHGVIVPHKKSSEPYVCDFCGREYWHKASITSHLTLTHITIASFECSTCDKKFKSLGNLNRHIKCLHSDIKNYACEVCGLMLTQKYRLLEHMEIHNAPSKCNICGKMVSNIKAHIKHHQSKTKKRCATCTICGKVIGKYRLAAHIKAVHQREFSSHKDNYVYTCKDCGQFFSRQQDLRQHEYVNHSQSKIFECNICGKFFRTVKLLNVHRFTHQPANIFCEICTNVYARRGALMKHQKKKHPELIAKKQMQETVKS